MEEKERKVTIEGKYGFIERRWRCDVCRARADAWVVVKGKCVASYCWKHLKEKAEENKDESGDGRVGVAATGGDGSAEGIQPEGEADNHA